MTPAAPWRVTEMQALAGYRLKVRFRDETQGTVDLSHLVTGSRAGVFAVLRDPNLFAQARIECGAVTWPGGLDLAPRCHARSHSSQGRMGGAGLTKASLNVPNHSD